MASPLIVEVQGTDWAALWVGAVGIIATATTALLAPLSARKNARGERLWAKEAAMYEELLADCAYEHAIREERFRLLKYDAATEQRNAERLRRAEPDWFALQGRIQCYGSEEVLAKFKAWRLAEQAAHDTKSEAQAAESQRGLGRSKRSGELHAQAEKPRQQASTAYNALIKAVQNELKRK